MKPVLMIHEIRDWMFRLPLEDYILTFDDGLYSQYYYFEKFKRINTPKYYFISTNIICPEETVQSEEFPHCVEAHEKSFSGDTNKHYMKWSQIQDIYQTRNCFIGGHSHAHQRHHGVSLIELYSRLTEDTAKMFAEFEKRNITITSFCYPYNEQYPLYQAILEKNNIKNIFGNERIAIEDLK